MSDDTKPQINMTNSVYAGGKVEGNITNISGNTIATDYTQMLDLLKKIEEKLPDLPISDDDKAEARAEIKTIEAQAASPKPKIEMIKDSLKTLNNILQGTIVGGTIANVLATLVTSGIPRF